MFFDALFFFFSITSLAHTVGVKPLYHRPRIYEVLRFMSEDECQHLIDRAVIMQKVSVSSHPFSISSFILSLILSPYILQFSSNFALRHAEGRGPPSAGGYGGDDMRTPAIRPLKMLHTCTQREVRSSLPNTSDEPALPHRRPHFYDEVDLKINTRIFYARSTVTFLSLL